MAIKKVTYELDGCTFSHNINCNKDGLFTAKLPMAVASTLGIHYIISKNTLVEVENIFNKAYTAYIDSKEEEILYIAVRYAASGFFNWSTNGRVLFGNNEKFSIHNRGMGDTIPCLGFDLQVVFKVTRNGRTTYFNAVKGKDISGIFRSEDRYKEDDVYYRYHEPSEHISTKYTLLPYDEEVLKTLQKLKTNLCTLSEGIFNIVSKDPEEMVNILKDSSFKILN